MASISFNEQVLPTLEDLKGKWDRSVYSSGAFADSTQIYCANNIAPHQRTEIELYDKDNNLIASASSSGGSCSAVLYPVAAGLDGDNGSTATSIKWNVDSTTFATCKLVVTQMGTTISGGQLYGGGFRLQGQTNPTLDFHNVSLKGSGAVTLTFQFTVAA